MTSLVARAVMDEAPFTRLRTRLRGPEWLGLAVIALIDLVWARQIGFHLILHWQDFQTLAVVFAIMIGLHLYGPRCASLIAEYLALSITMAVVFTVFCYLAFGSSGALVDQQLLLADQALNFDWLSGFRFIAAHPLLSHVLSWLYGSLNLQVLYVCVFLGVMDRGHALREMFWLVFVSALFTDLIAIALPAYGPFQIFGLSSHGDFLPDMKHLKSGHDLTFALSKMTGVICFPSFHTVMALSYAYCVRRTGFVGFAIAAMNFVMIFSIPYFGGHYLVDIIAGAGVTLLSLGIVKACQRRGDAIMGPYLRGRATNQRCAIWRGPTPKQPKARAYRFLRSESRCIGKLPEPKTLARGSGFSRVWLWPLGLQRGSLQRHPSHLHARHP
jgi:hypothetical protein